MQGLRKLFETVSISAAMLLAGPARADDTALVYPLDLDHSACPEEAFVAAEAKSLESHRRVQAGVRMPNGVTRASGIPTLDDGDNRPVRRAFRGSRFRHDEAPKFRDTNGPQKALPIETPLREVDENAFPLLPYFQAADENVEADAIELAGFLENEPSTCPAEEGAPEGDEECTDVLEGEAAREILALRKRMGPALGGTAFDADPSEMAGDPDAVATRAGAIRYLVQTIRMLEQQEADDLVPFEFEVSVDMPSVHELTSPAVVSPKARETLREAAEQLEDTANLLERQELYAQADDVRQKSAELRLQARGVANLLPTCGGRAMRPTVRSPLTCPATDTCPGIEACPANDTKPQPPRCAAEGEHQPIIWVPRHHEPGAVRSFEASGESPSIPSTRPNAWPEASLPGWNLGYPVTGPCGATSGIRVGIPATSTSRSTIRTAPGEIVPQGTIERLPPIVESSTRPGLLSKGTANSAEPAFPLPVRSSLDAISETLNWEREMDDRLKRESEIVESELLIREVHELNKLTLELAKQGRAGRRPWGVCDPEAVRHEVSRLRRQLETSTLR